MHFHPLASYTRGSRAGIAGAGLYERYPTVPTLGLAVSKYFGQCSAEHKRNGIIIR
jgi:hypothetical protein